jgi:hypothetical protein
MENNYISTFSNFSKIHVTEYFMEEMEIRDAMGEGITVIGASGDLINQKGISTPVVST